MSDQDSGIHGRGLDILAAMLEDPRSCNACGGAVDVMTIQKHLDDGRSVPTRIGACLRCGKWFNEAGLLELALRPDGSQPDQT